MKRGAKIVLACATLSAASGCLEPIDPTNFGTGADVCSAVPVTALAPVITDPGAGAPQPIWGRETGKCRWRSPAGSDMVTLTVESDPLGSDAARSTLRGGRPAPSVGIDAIVDSYVTRLGWTVIVRDWIGGASTFELNVKTAKRVEVETVEQLASRISGTLRSDDTFLAPDSDSPPR